MTPHNNDSLQLIADMTAAFAASRDIAVTFRQGLARIADAIQAEAASLFLLQNGGIECVACFGPVDVTGLRLPEGAGIVGRTIAENRLICVESADQDPAFAREVDRKTGFETRSILCAPLAVQDRVLGAIQVINKRGAGDFDEPDRRLLMALAASAAIAIQNAELMSGLIEQEALRRELEMAREIQQAMLPQDLPEGLPIAAANRPARTVSGDFYDIVDLGQDRWAFAIADVSGKGMNAALMAAKTSSLFRCLVKQRPDPVALLSAINEELCETASRGMFVTMIAGILDRRAQSVILANAGHEPAIHLSAADGAVAMIAAETPPLGIAPGLIEGANSISLSLAEGNLFLYTDGLTERRLPGGLMLGQAGLVEVLRRSAKGGAPEAVAGVLAEVARQGGELRDDVTFMAICGERI